MSKELEIETKIALEDDAAELDVAQLGNLSEFTCPGCHGTLVRIKNGKLQRFRCHTSHAFSTGSLLAELTESVERFANAIRAVEERITLLKHLARQTVLGGTMTTRHQRPYALSATGNGRRYALL